MKNSFTYSIVLIGALAIMSFAYSESSMEKTKQENQSADQEKREPAKKPAVNNKPLKEFTPSEEISIDKPVAFPVDI